ncbi:hypothetical protein MPTK1_3g00240 [Marchantia polymorpha subsp. ruderalis]|uniref:Uncharacterized protein n=2 Tax=Marchantia polymorpha TaxID=3197 RepID=A0AAF6AVT9_MARPO|nr:hypothetical protein MARPO_0007s0021 [Marchantia polymorpha]BBN03873.1 hypothetical protein Mp_3g00240 [Marchantia polymorpha subsp. ruderalis]|eukprot:PTQ47562.1 hypothetical protein MARPO_0007s0021 [Marchantia polymorpha]
MCMDTGLWGFLLRGTHLESPVAPCWGCCSFCSGSSLPLARSPLPNPLPASKAKPPRAHSPLPSPPLPSPRSQLPPGPPRPGPRPTSDRPPSHLCSRSVSVCLFLSFPLARRGLSESASDPSPELQGLDAHERLIEAGREERKEGKTTAHSGPSFLTRRERLGPCRCGVKLILYSTFPLTRTPH